MNKDNTGCLIIILIFLGIFILAIYQSWNEQLCRKTIVYYSEMQFLGNTVKVNGCTCTESLEKVCFITTKEGNNTEVKLSDLK